MFCRTKCFAIYRIFYRNVWHFSICPYRRVVIMRGKYIGVAITSNSIANYKQILSQSRCKICYWNYHTMSLSDVYDLTAWNVFIKSNVIDWRMSVKNINISASELTMLSSENNNHIDCKTKWKQIRKEEKHNVTRRIIEWSILESLSSQIYLLFYQPPIVWLYLNIISFPTFIFNWIK